MGIFHWNPDPEIFNFLGLSLRYYGLLFVIGLGLGYWVVYNIYIKENKNIAQLDSLLSHIAIGTILGARIGHCLFYEPSYFSQHPLEILLPFRIRLWDTFEFIGFRGLASHGGGIGVLIGLYIFSKKTKTDLWWLYDRIAVAVPLTGTFIRLGNFMNAEIIGVPTNGTFGIIFDSVDSLPRHPAQLYEAFVYLFTFAVLYFLYQQPQFRNRKRFLSGLFLCLLFSFRFVIEFFKEHQVAFEDGLFLNMGQLLSIPFVLFGLYLIYISKKTKKIA